MLQYVVMVVLFLVNNVVLFNMNINFENAL
jgi:hypothetical protein